MKNKTVFIEGMSGSGKSSLAQHIWIQLKAQNVNAEWFHEEETNHPLYREAYDALLENNNLEGYQDRIIGNWNAFFSNHEPGLKINIFESQILLSNLASLLWTGYSRADFNCLREFFLSVINSCKENHYIYLSSENPECILENIIKNRGDAWRTWYIDFFNKSAYAKKNHVPGYAGIIELWKDVHKIGNAFFAQLKCKKIKLDITAQNWKRYYLDISAYFQYGFAPPVNAEIELAEYTGRYQWQAEEIKVHLKNDNLYCDFGWPGLPLIPQKEKDHFYIKAFPHELQFRRDQGGIDSIKITGKDIAGLYGRVYQKIC